jgi:outer membrane protein OmpA-like peptidoglycan-associated protein
VNSSLEDVNLCSEYSFPDSPSGWFYVNQYGPRGYAHAQPRKASSGLQYFDILVAGADTETRSYWQTMLLCKLKAGTRYRLSVAVAANHIGPNKNDIGFYFTDSLIFCKGDTLLQPSNYISFSDAKAKRLKNYWFSLEKYFTAGSDAQFLIIGNFSQEDNTIILEKRRSKNNSIILYADDIIVEQEEKNSCPEAASIKDSLYQVTNRHTLDTAIKKTTIPGFKDDTTNDKSVSLLLTKKTDTIRLNNMLFEFDSHVLKHTDSIEKFRAVFTDTSIKKIEIIGFADDSGTEIYNKELSLKRAREIGRLLSVLFGIHSSKIAFYGQGISNTYSDKKLNRRVEIYIYH